MLNNTDTCMECGAGAPLLRCNECNANLCEKCSHRVHSFAICKGHIVVPLMPTAEPTFRAYCNDVKKFVQSEIAATSQEKYVALENVAKVFTNLRKFFDEKERCDRYQEDQRIINGIIVAARELTVSIDGYYELDYDTDEVIADFENFRDAFTKLMNAGRSEFVAYKELENVTVHGRIATVNDFVTLFTEYVGLHQEDVYFINSLGKELPIYGVYASDDDAKIAKDIDAGVEVFPLEDPKVIRL